MLPEPKISENFTLKDIRAIRDYNSARHITMTHEEIISDIKKGAEEFLTFMKSKKTHALFNKKI